MKPRPLELLAPAKDAETAIVAIDCGADAVYMGGPHHGARAALALPVRHREMRIDARDAQRLRRRGETRHEQTGS